MQEFESQKFDRNISRENEQCRSKLKVSPPIAKMIKLKMREFVVRQAVSDKLLESADVNVIVDTVMRNMIMEIHRKFSSLEIKRQEVKYPADWKQAFKERWFPKWALKKWPVQYTTIMLAAETLFYDFHNPLPGYEYQIVISREE